MTPRTFHLDSEKALQAAGVLLRCRPSGGMSYLRLIKELYLADRESLRQTGHPMTFDQWKAMDHGPVLSGVYDIIRGQSVDAPRWHEFIERDGYTLRLKSEPQVTRLSKLDIRILEQVSAIHRGTDDWTLVEQLHDLPEWRDNQPPAGSSRPIEIRDVLKALNMEAMADDIVRNVQEIIASRSPSKVA